MFVFPIRVQPLSAQAKIFTAKRILCRCLRTGQLRSVIRILRHRVGFWRRRRLATLREEHGIAMALHMAGTPVCAMASVHCAAATSNFMVLENHSVDNPWWDNIKLTPFVARGPRASQCLTLSNDVESS